MNIVFVESYPQVMYGQQHTLMSLLNNAKNDGHHCRVVTTNDGPFVNNLRHHGNEVVIHPYPSQLAVYGGAIYNYGFKDKLSLVLQSIKYFLELRVWLKSNRPDILFCNDMRGLLTMGVAARSLGIPVVIWDKLDKPHGLLDWFQLPIAKVNIIISDAVKVKYPVIQQSIFARKIHKIHEGVDLPTYQNLKNIGGNLGFHQNTVNFAIVGSISSRKGHDRILKLIPEISSKYPGFRLLLVGDYDDTSPQFFDGLPNINHPSVIHTGFRDDIPNVMHSIDALLILSRQEGMGMVIVEAMAASRPVIGTRAGGIPEVVVDGETGLLVEGDDDEALLNAISQLCDDPDKRQRMGSAGRARVEANFDRPKQHRKVIKLMEQLVEGAR